MGGTVRSRCKGYEYKERLRIEAPKVTVMRNKRQDHIDQDLGFEQLHP